MPKSIASVKGAKLRQDIGARAQEAILKEQELVLKQEADLYQKGLVEVSRSPAPPDFFFSVQIQTKLLAKDTRVAKLEAQVKQLTEEVDRRKFLEAKVQTYVRSLIDQNEKCKSYIRGLYDGENGQQARKFLQGLEMNLYDEHDGQSTENEEGDDEVDEDEDPLAISDI